MKWVTIISFVVVLSLTESRTFQKRDHVEGHHDQSHKIGDAYKLLGQKDFEYISMLTFAQNFQKCPFQEHEHRVRDVEEIGAKCSKGSMDAECEKSVATVLADEMCKTPENAEKYPFHPDCCSKADRERYACFVSHKLTDHDALPPYQKPLAEQVCKDYQENRASFMRHYIYEAGRRYPLMYASSILAVARHFEVMTDECCKDPAHTAECFAEKKPALKLELTIISAYQKHSCYVLKHFGERVLKAKLLAQTSQKLPRTRFSEVSDIVHDLVHLTESCCRGDMMECMADRLALNKKVCEKKADLSSKLQECCDKEGIEQTECIVKMENDDKPPHLSPEASEFIENRLVCKKFEDDKDGLWGRFLHEFSIRHQELSTQMLLRIAAGYEKQLTKCCAEEDAHECLAQAMVGLKEAIKTDVELQKSTCDQLEKLGHDQFQKQILVRYTEKMPQAPTQTLIEMTGNVVRVVEKCCKVPAEKQMPCSEGSLAIIIGGLCQKMEGHFVNDQVSHCCKDSYGNQRPCFTMLGPDKTYVPPALSADSFKFTEELCAVGDGKELERKLTFLADLTKLKPGMEEEQRKKISAEFVAMLEQCCKADNHAECFAAEGPKLVQKCQGILTLEVHAAV